MTETVANVLYIIIENPKMARNTCSEHISIILTPYNRYWIEIVSSTYHPKTLLSSRCVKLAGSLTASKKSSVRYLSSLCSDDRRTLLERTLANISSECQLTLQVSLQMLLRNQWSIFPFLMISSGGHHCSLSCLMLELDNWKLCI